MTASSLIRTTDNHPGLTLTDEEQLKNIDLIAGKKIRELKGSYQDNILIIPAGFEECRDKIADECICDLDRHNNMKTGNIMGVISIGRTRLKIASRFDSADNDSDFLLHYMLGKVLSINLVDLNFTFNRDNIFDLLVYFFPMYLKRAIRQGIYREYRSFRHNDANLRGAIDFSRHISLNMPFTGRIAYNTREHSTDNDITELVRHTIEYIGSSTNCAGILNCDKETADSVSLIKSATPSYSKAERGQVISRNLRPSIHPYYSAYLPLQKLCVQILQHQEVKYGDDENDIYGILFDGAWLWEEYLATFLIPMGFSHPSNKNGTGAMHIFEDGTGERYPDFYIDSKFVLDAKYKKLQKENISTPDDINQIIAYMGMLEIGKGGFIYPADKDTKMKQKTLTGSKNLVYSFGLEIPDGMTSYRDFCSAMEKSEEAIKNNISQIIL